MFGSAILEVGLGLVIVFLLMSLIVTQVNNVISWTLNLKARVLHNHIKDKVLKGDFGGVLNHPLVDMADVDGRAKYEVQHVDTEAFAQAVSTLSIERLIREVEGAVNDSSIQSVKATGSELLLELDDVTQTVENLQRLRLEIEHVPELTTKQSLLTEMDALLSSAGDYQEAGGTDTRIAFLEHEIKRLDNYVLRTSLSLLLESSQDFKDAIGRLSRWFNEQVTMTSKIYERYMTLISFGVGLCLAIVINVDALHISNTLYQDADLRQSVIAFAEGSIEEVETLVESVQDDEAVTEETSSVGEDETLQETDLEELQEAFSDVEIILTLLTDSQMPIWWGEENRFLSVARIIGWLITAAATTLGAPFWFDLLKRRLNKTDQPASPSAPAS